MSLAAFFPQPTPVPWPGRGVVLARQLRLRDLAFLEGWIAAAAGPTPEPDLAALDPASRRAALRAAYDAAAAGAEGPLGTDAGAALLFGTAGGIAAVLSVALRETPGFGGALCDALAAEVAAVESASDPALVAWRRIHRIAFDADPLAEAKAAIDAEIGVSVPRGGDGIPWPKALGEMAAAVPWASPQALGDLYLCQWRLARSGGKPRADSDPIPEGWTLARFDAEVVAPRRAFWAEGPPATRPGA